MIRLLLVAVCVLSWGIGRAQERVVEPTWVGYLVPVQRAMLTSEAPGRILEVHVREGQTVRKGAVLIRLDARKEELDLKRAEAQVELADARARLAEGVKMRDIANAERSLARVELDRARLALQSRVILAPFDGTVLRLNAEVGGFTNPAMLGIATSAGLCELANLDDWLAETAISEQQAAGIKPGQKCEVSLPGVRTPIRATVDRLSPIVDPSRRSVPVTIRLGKLPAEVTPRINASVTVRFLAE